MQKEGFHTKNLRAFSLVEVILAIGLFSALVLAMSGGFAFAIQSTKAMSQKNKAIFLADEGLEAARSIRNEAFANLTVGTFGLAQTGNKWVLSGGSDVTGDFTRTVNISTIDSTTRQIITTVSWNTPYADSVVYTMYLTDWLRTVSPSWSSPFLASTLNLTGNNAGNKVAISGNYAYVVRAAGNPSLIVVDISNSSAPVESSTTIVAGTLTDIFILGNTLYITSDQNNAELRMFDISTPTTPTLIGTLDLTGNGDASSVYVIGTTAYVGRLSTADNEFYIVNVAVPATPTVVGSINLTSSTNSVYVSGNFAYLATSNNAGEFVVLNITVPATPTIAATFNITGNTTCSASNGYSTNVLIGCANGTLYAFNVTTPAAPTQTGTYAAGAAINDISFNTGNTIAFIGTSSATSEFQAVNISNLASMALLGSFNAAATINGLAYDSARDAVVTVGSNSAGELTIIKTL